MKKHNLLTYLKIIVCCAVFFCVPVLADFAADICQSRTIALTLAINTAALFLIFANHQLAALHWRRFMTNIKENMIYILFSALFIWACSYLAHRFFAFHPESIDWNIVTRYPFFAPMILITYTFSYAFCFNMTFKLMTDQIKIHREPLVTILLSGILFGVYMTLSQFVLAPYLDGIVDTTFIVKGFITNFMVSLCCSYCYNQTRSVIPMTFGLSLATIFIMI